MTNCSDTVFLPLSDSITWLVWWVLEIVSLRQSNCRVSSFFDVFPLFTKNIPSLKSLTEVGSKKS